MKDFKKLAWLLRSWWADRELMQIALPPEVHKTIQDAAVKHNVSFSEAMKKIIKIGVLVIAAEEEPGRKLILEENGEQTVLTIFDDE